MELYLHFSIHLHDTWLSRERILPGNLAVENEMIPTSTHCHGVPKTVAYSFCATRSISKWWVNLGLVCDTRKSALLFAVYRAYNYAHFCHVGQRQWYNCSNVWVLMETCSSIRQVADTPCERVVVIICTWKTANSLTLNKHTFWHVKIFSSADDKNSTGMYTVKKIIFFNFMIIFL